MMTHMESLLNVLSIKDTFKFTASRTREGTS